LEWRGSAEFPEREYRRYLNIGILSTYQGGERRETTSNLQ